MTIFEPGAMGGIEIGGTAPMSFIHGGGQVAADAVVEWDFDNDDDFSEAVEDVTGFVVVAETATGRDFPSQLTGRAGPGQLKLTLRNDDDRFSYFNAASPLNQDGNSLRVGRKIRVRTAEAVAADPVLLRRDRFNRPDGPLGTTETNQTEGSDSWLFTAGTNFGDLSYAVQAKRCVALGAGLGEQHAFVGTGGLTEYYVQVALGPLTINGNAGLIARRNGSTNYVFVRMIASAGLLQLGEVISGVQTVLDSYSIASWPGITIGLKSGPGSAVTAYVGGVPVASGVTGLTDATGLVGIRYLWNASPPTPAPTFDDFHVFDDVVTSIEGVLWTGDVTAVRPRVPVGGDKTAEITAEGRLAHAALPDVASPRAVFGAKTGVLVGDVLAKARLAHPPGIIDEGTVVTGPVGIDDGKALDLARKFEETEVGFLHEMPEGAIAFQDRAARVDAPVEVAFSDAPGAQFSYSELSPLDQRRDIVNRVTAGVAPDQPDGISVVTRSNNTAGNVTNHVDVLLPTTAAGDLLVVFIASTVAASGQGWNVPIWWGVHRQFGTQDDDSIRTRVYSHHCDGTESGTTVRFYTAPANIGGAWIAKVYRIEDWFEAGDTKGMGVALGEFVRGDRPGPLVSGWGRVPALWIAVNAGLTSLNGGELDTDLSRFPEGYGDSSATFINGAVNGFDVGLHTAHKLAVDEADHPTTFDGLEGFVFNESAVFAVRGFNGPHVVLPTIQNPERFEASPGRFVTVDDVSSQDELRTIRSMPDPSNLFATEADAEGYADAVLATYSDDRPIFSLMFPATLSAAYRGQAFRRRVGDKIRFVAENDSGMGVNGDYFIESVGHRVTDGAKQWWVTWELSPA